MIDYLEKFKALDQRLRDAVSSQEAVEKISILEKEFGVSLSELIIKIMVKEVALVAVPGFLVSDLKIDLGKADELYQRLRNEVLVGVLDYLEGSAIVNPTKVEAQGLTSDNVDPRLREDDRVEFVTLEKPLANPGFMFDPEDEAEAKLHGAKSIENSETSPDWNEAAAKIVSLAKLSFGSEVLNERLKNILVTYLKGVRNRVDTKQFMQKSIADGGLAMDENLADQIFLLAQEFAIKPDLAPLKPKFPVLEDSLIGRDIPYDFSKEMERLGQLKNGEGKQAVGAIDPYAFGRPKEQVGKVVMSDVKVAPPKIMNQLDELRFIDTIIFRRLSTDPEVAAKRVKEKIELLEFESYHKRLEGIKSWRQSPINKIYLKICEISVADNLAVGQVISNLQAKDEPCLSPAEFIAIMKLNKELRY